MLSSTVIRLGLVVRRSVGKRKDQGSTLRFGSPTSSNIVVYRHCLVTLPCTINETLKWLATLRYHSHGDIVALDISFLSPPTSWDFGPRLYHRMAEDVTLIEVTNRHQL